MQKMMLRFSPLFFLLLFFSCAKDNDLIPAERSAEFIQAKKGADPCWKPCKKLDVFQVTDIDGCSAVLNWAHDKPTCGTYIIKLIDLSTGISTFINAVASPFTLTDLEPCTQYTVGVSHVTDQCASLPVQLSFQTDCKKCKDKPVCNIDCEDPDYAFIDAISSTSATANFGFDSPTCGYFYVGLRNNTTNTTTYFSPAESPLVLSGLDPCTSYTISISHITDKCARLPKKLYFTTSCGGEYCEVTSLDASCLNIVDFWLDDDEPGLNDLNVEYMAEDPTGYIDSTKFEFYIAPGEEVEYIASSVCICPDIQGVFYFKLWIDFDQDYEFESSELVLDYTSIPINSPGTECLSFSLPGFDFPDITACGLRARYIITTDPNTEPCGTFATGQALDFTINSAPGCGEI